MSYLVEAVLAVPRDPASREYVWKRQVKVLEAGSAAALETLVNDFLTTLRTTYEYVAVIDIVALSPANNKTQVVISYGWFEPDIY
jgi:hypothetical protein